MLIKAECENYDEEIAVRFFLNAAREGMGFFWIGYAAYVGVLLQTAIFGGQAGLKVSLKCSCLKLALKTLVTLLLAAPWIVMVEMLDDPLMKKPWLDCFVGKALPVVLLAFFLTIFLDKFNGCLCLIDDPNRGSCKPSVTRESQLELVKRSRELNRD